MAKPNAIGWFDIYVADMKRAVSFYEKVLRRRLDKLEDPTGETQMMIFSGDQQAYGAAGALVQAPHARPGAGGTMVYFTVEDCAVEESRIAAAGGKLIRPKFSIGPFGWVSIGQDTEGNLFGLSSMK